MHYGMKVKYHFDAAHHLLNYDGPCANMHGHRWEVELALAFSELGENGMLIDFKTVKQIFHAICDELDHSCLNDKIEQPTAENIAAYLYGKVKETPLAPVLVSMMVWESPDCVISVWESDDEDQ